MEIIIVFLIIAFVMVCYLCHRFKSDRRDSVSQTNRVSGGINTVRVQTKLQESVASKGGDAKDKQVPQIKVEKRREQQVGVCSAKLSSGEANGENKSFVYFLVFLVALNATNSQAISYLSRMRSLNCTPDTSPAFIFFNISFIIL